MIKLVEVKKSVNFVQLQEELKTVGVMAAMLGFAPAPPREGVHFYLNTISVDEDLLGREGIEGIQKVIMAHNPKGDPLAYRDYRRNEYPSIGDQLDAMHKAREGNWTELEKIDTLIKSVKAKYPKP